MAVILIAIPIAISVSLYSDNAADQNREAVKNDLMQLGSKALEYFRTPKSQGGGGNSFVGLTANAAGIAKIASTSFTKNLNGTYTISSAGTTTQVVIQGVGKTKVSGVYPTYRLRVTSTRTRLIKVR